MVLLKSVLYILSIYFLSFFKVPMGIVKEIETLFRRFLWGGDEGKSKLHWVAWSAIFKDKSEGDWVLRI